MKHLLACASAIALLAAIPASATNLQRLSAEFQNSTSLGSDGEIVTNAPAGPNGTGGIVVYDKMVGFPADVNVLYVTFSGNADTHNGSALLMTATVNGNLIEPLAGQLGTGGGGPTEQTGWYTLSKLPAALTGNNCNDGGGGTGDCHDNAVMFSGCYALGPNDDKKTAHVQVMLADMPGGGDNLAFYERATFYIDGQHDNTGTMCQGVDSSPH
jgi:hypothetical protein